MITCRCNFPDEASWGADELSLYDAPQSCSFIAFLVLLVLGSLSKRPLTVFIAFLIAMGERLTSRPRQPGITHFDRTLPSLQAPNQNDCPAPTPQQPLVRVTGLLNICVKNVWKTSGQYEMSRVRKFANHMLKKSVMNGLTKKCLKFRTFCENNNI